MKLVSVIFHPLLMATYTSILLYLLVPTIYSPVLQEFIPYLIGVTFLITAVIPALSLLMMKFTGRIGNLDITIQSERTLPFILIACFYGFSTYMFYSKLHVSVSVVAIMMITTLLILSLSILSVFKKISIHAAAIWGLCGIMSAISINYMDTSVNGVLAILFLAAGLTTTSRLYLQKHEPIEIWIGAIFGFASCFLGTYFYA